VPPEKIMKIAVLVKSFILAGGAERHAVEITRRLMEKGHEIDLYARYVDERLIDGMHHVRVPNRCTFSSAGNSLSFAREAARLLEGKRYDVIHSHERGYLQDVLTLHTFSYKSGLRKYSFLRRLDMTFLSYRSWIYLWLEKRQMATPRLVAVSDLIREDVRKNYNRSVGVHVIPPGVDLELFHPAWITEHRKPLREEMGIGHGEMVVLFVGSEFRRKGLDFLIPAIGPGMRLIVVGQGERLEHYRKMAAERVIGDRIHFTGLVTRDVRGSYAIADVVVLPSLSDAFGMSILEGMACGIPVVTSPDAGVSSLISSGENGFVVSDSVGLASALTRLMDPSLRRRLGAAALKTAENHSWDKVADAYESLFYAVAEQKQSPVSSLIRQDRAGR
jgi:UDP-glucose:(heptosyl)LPS alpha-1,3-glucosyltransferase